MSEESTTPDLEELIRRSMEAFNRRDLDAAVTIYTPDAVWDISWAGLGVHAGREAIRGFFEDWRGSYEDFEQVLEEFRDFGKGVTLFIGIQRGRPRGSDRWLQFRWGAVATWADGLLEYVMNYASPDEARAAAERLAKERG